MKPLIAVLVALLLVMTGCGRGAGSLRDRVAARRGAPAPGGAAAPPSGGGPAPGGAPAPGGGALDDGADGPSMTTVPAGVRVVRNVAYGTDALQRFDVYLPANPKDAPVIFMVHGGGWSRGDKTAATVVQNKVAYFVPKGYILVSTDYRMLPGTAPLEQAADVARALAKAQAQAPSWGGNGSKFIVMGHSAGAHLVALLASSPTIAKAAGAAPWLGTVALDSAALDVVRIMELPHLPLYDQAFGSDPANWRAASPYQVLETATAPLLAVCSTQRIESCQQAKRFVDKDVSLGAHASVLQEDLSHKEINDQVGTAGAYTDAVAAFVKGLLSN